MLSAAAVLVVVAIGASRLFDPFSGDQALFLVGAKAMHAGGILYRDFWDIKQPGIFGFFFAAGSLFGFTQLGVHVLELLWEAAFAVALVVALRAALSDPRWAAFAPLGVVGATYAGSPPWHLLQVEELAGFPIFVCMWLAGAAAHRPASTARGHASAALSLGSGFAGGIALMFKLMLLPVILAVTVAITFDWQRRRSRSDSSRFWLRWILGLLVPLFAYGIYAIGTKSLGIATQTTFVVPLQIITFAPHAPLARLSDAALRLLFYFRGIIVLALIGAATMRTPAARPWRAASLAWIVSGVAVILVQTQSWWQYQFVLLVPPIGILATFGIAFLGERAQRGGGSFFVALAAGGAVAYIAVPLPQGAIGTMLRVAHERPFASSAALERYRVGMSPEYANSALDAAFLFRRRSDPGPIYVFGNPLIYILTNRAQDAAMTSWSSYLDPPSLWARLDDELSVARPTYIFVSRERRNDISAARSPKIFAMLSHDYIEVGQTTDGAWYRRLHTAAFAGAESWAAAALWSGEVQPDVL